MGKKGKVKNPCKICLEAVKDKSGIQCQGACKKWAHFTCLKYTPGKIRDIKAGLVKVSCPCPNCDPVNTQVLNDPLIHCGKKNCLVNSVPICEDSNYPIKQNEKPAGAQTQTFSNTSSEDSPAPKAPNQKLSNGRSPLVDECDIETCKTGTNVPWCRKSCLNSEKKHVCQNKCEQENMSKIDQQPLQSQQSKESMQSRQSKQLKQSKQSKKLEHKEQKEQLKQSKKEKKARKSEQLKQSKQVKQSEESPQLPPSVQLKYARSQDTINPQPIQRTHSNSNFCRKPCESPPCVPLPLCAALSSDAPTSIKSSRSYIETKTSEDSSASGLRECLSDSALASASMTRDLLLNAMEQMCSTVGNFSNQVRELMCKMIETLEKNYT